MFCFESTNPNNCSNCRKMGHVIRECTLKPKYGITSKSCAECFSQRLCMYCGKKNHKSADCRENMKKKKGGQANIAMTSVTQDETLNEKQESATRIVRFPGYNDELGFAADEGQTNIKVNSKDKKVGFELDAKVGTNQPENVTSEVANVCQIDGMTYPSFNEGTAIGDSGTSCHLFGSDEGFEDVEKIDENVTGIGENVLRAIKKGRKRCVFKQKDGSTVERVLYPAKFVPGIGRDLFSLTSEMSSGASLGSDAKRNIVLKYEDGRDICFDRRCKTRDGWIAGVEIVQPEPEVAALSEDSEPPKRATRKDVNQLHAELGHPGEDVTRAIGAHRGLQVTGTFAPCKDCAVAKAKQKKIGKKASKKSQKPGERLCIDISSPTAASFGGKHHWLLVVDENSDLCWSYFLKKKSETTAKMVALIKELKSKYGIEVKYIRCDNAGENDALKRACLEEGLGVTFEMTAPSTPQQNGKVERKFATLYGRMRAMLRGCKHMKTSVRKQLWAEAANLATDLNNILVSYGEKKNPFQKFYGEKAKSNIASTKVFGEMVVVADRKAIKSKLADRGKSVCGQGMQRTTLQAYIEFGLQRLGKS